jgi:hypothetical protein
MKRSLIIVAVLLILTACSAPDQPAPDISITTAQKENESPAALPVENKENNPTRVPTQEAIQTNKEDSATPVASETINLVGPKPTQAVSADPEILGPDSFPQGVNPLTGQPVKDPSLLSLPPALVSVTNFPVTARPQAGLSFSPYVYEMYVGEGMTRFLAMFYGEYPSKPVSDQATSSQTPSDNASIGPIRSGRLPYESLRNLYNGFLVMASASPEVGSQLKSTNNVYNPTDNDINAAMVDVTRLQSFAEASSKGKDALNLTGNAFSASTPPNGKTASALQIFYNYLNQVEWTYDLASGAYLRFQDNADGSGKFYPVTDRLTGNQLAFDNVILLYARHQVLNRAGTLIDIDLLYTSGKAFLFRDGQVYPMKWTTANGAYEKSTGRLRPIRFLDEEGNPMLLKPGNTWVEIVDLSALMQEPQPGTWKVRFFNPAPKN